jgi:hypothetical protein
MLRVEHFAVYYSVDVGGIGVSPTRLEHPGAQSKHHQDPQAQPEK